MPKCIDLTGQRFGKLTVLERTENIGTSAGCRCRCDCGNETFVRSSNLLSGGTKSCGCLRRGENLAGQRFGKLLAQEQVRDAKGHLAWRCLCDCGKEIVVSTRNLRYRNQRSCGCLRSHSPDLVGQKFGRLPDKEGIECPKSAST